MKRNLLFIALFCFSLGLNAQFWSQQNTNMPGTSTGVDQVSVVDSNIVWVNGFNGSGAGPYLPAHAHTQDGGNTWVAGSYNGMPATVHSYVLTGVTYDKAFCVAMDTVTGGAASFWKTTDGGSTWSLVTGILNTGTTTFADGVKFWNSNKGFCYGDPVSGEFDIYTTNDGGTTWNDVPGSNIPNPSPSAEYGFNGSDCTAIVPGGIGFFITNWGRVYKTTDYGNTWIVTPNKPFSPTVALGSNKIYASSADYIICAAYTTSSQTWAWMYTADGGTTWSTYAPYYEYTMCNVPGPTNSFVSTSPFSSSVVGVAYSNDGGMTWTDYTDPTYLQPAGTNIQCLGVGFYDGGIGWVGNYDQAATINSILKYHNPISGDDAGAITILQPTSTTNIGANITVEVRIQNFGITTLTSSDLAYKVGNSTPVTATWTGSLAPGATADYTFTTPYVGPDTNSYELCAYTTLAGDIHPLNDATCSTLLTNDGINEGNSAGLTLNQNYPNPSNGSTIIGYTVPENGEVVLTLMNSIGKAVYTESKKAETGYNKITLNTSQFDAGVYFYEFTFNGNKYYKKMIIF